MALKGKYIYFVPMYVYEITKFDRKVHLSMWPHYLAINATML